MALGKYSRINDRKPSSNYCSTVTLVVFVALCLVGVWMLSSSSIEDSSSRDNKNEVRVQVAEGEDNNSTQFEGNNVYSPKDAAEGDSNVSSSKPETIAAEDIPNSPEKSVVNVNEGNLEKRPVGKDVDIVNKLEDVSKPESISAEDNPNSSEKSVVNVVEGNQEKRPVDMGADIVNKPEDASKPETENGELNVNDRQSNLKGTKAADVEAKPGSLVDGEDNSITNKPDSKENEKTPVSDENEKKLVDTMDGSDGGNQLEKQQNEQEKESEQSSSEKKQDGGVFRSGAQAELLNETTVQNGSWSTQAAESKKEKDMQVSSKPKQEITHSWKLCNVMAGADYIPCLDNIQAIRKLRSTKHYEHRERHCPDVAPTCLVPLPKGYQRPIKWPTSREKIWYHNVPHTQLAEYKGHQNWVKVSGEYLTFPGGGTQFKHGALHYIEFLEKTVPEIKWGKFSRVVLDVGCGVASFGGYLFEKDALTMSFAPKDEHEAQVQFALERGIPAISAVMGTKRLPFAARVFDAVHCARCRVPWYIEGGKLLLELNRVLRPGGFFVWSATPVYQKLDEDVQIWNAMKRLTKSMCWELVGINKDKVNGVGAVIFKKPTSNECYEKRSRNEPPLCQESDDPNAAWNVPLQSCIHKIPVDASERGSCRPELWPVRLNRPPYWLSSSQVGVYGRKAPEDFTSDNEHWKRVASKSYLNGMGIDWSSVRNIMDMRAVYGGFAAALRGLNAWVMNVVAVDSPDTLPIIYERGLFGIYHDWCESFSTYPRSYDLLHADHLFSKIKNKCSVVGVMAEADRILRPEGWLIVRDELGMMGEVEGLVRSLQWEVRLTYSMEREGLLLAHKTTSRPHDVEAIRRV